MKSMLRIPPPGRLPGFRRLQRSRTLVAVSLGLLFITAFAAYFLHSALSEDSPKLVHVSFDASRDLYRSFNQAVAQQLPQPTQISMSHVGSTRQASSLADLRSARVLSLSSTWEIHQVASQWNVAKNSNNPQPLPFHTTLAFVFRAGHPQPPSHWSELFHSEHPLILPAPGQSGAGRCAILALYLAAYEIHGHDPAATRQALQQLLFQTKIIDATSQTALARFARAPANAIFITWESQGRRLDAIGFPQLKSHTPPHGPLIRPAIALLDRTAKTPASVENAQAYLALQRTPEFLQLALQHGFRIGPPDQLYEIEHTYPELADLWQQLFAQGGIYDSLESLSRAYQGL